MDEKSLPSTRGKRVASQLSFPVTVMGVGTSEEVSIPTELLVELFRVMENEGWHHQPWSEQGLTYARLVAEVLK